MSISNRSTHGLRNMVCGITCYIKGYKLHDTDYIKIQVKNKPTYRDIEFKGKHKKAKR